MAIYFIIWLSSTGIQQLGPPYLDSTAQNVHQHLPLELLRELLVRQLVPQAGLGELTEVVLLLLDLACLVVRGTIGPDRVHAIAVSYQVLSACLSVGRV